MKTKITIAFVLIVNSLIAQITEIGKASFYADKFDGRITASGEVFKQNKLTAAHRTLPFGSKVKVTNLDNNRTVTVIVNDRGPFVNDRVIDLSKKAAVILDFVKKGVANVKMEVLSVKHKKQQPEVVNSIKTNPEHTSKNKLPTLPISPTTKTSNSYYKIKTQQTQPQGYGIQIASYQEAANLVKICNDIQKAYEKDVFVQITEKNNSKFYKLIIGTFSNKAQAEQFSKILENKFKGCFIIAF